MLGCCLSLLLLTLFAFLHFFGEYQAQGLKIKRALQHPFLEGKLSNPLLQVDSLQSLRYCLAFVCSGKFGKILQALGLEPVNHFHVWQFRVKGALTRKTL